MNKEWYKSKTVWGGLLLGVEAFFVAIGVEFAWAHAAASGVGTFLTIFGFRDAISKK